MSGKVITSSGIGSNTGLDATVTQPEVTSSGTPPATSDGVPSVSTSSTTRSDFMDLPLVYTDLLQTQDVLSVVATPQTGNSIVTAAMCGQEYY